MKRILRGNRRNTLRTPQTVGRGVVQVINSSATTEVCSIQVGVVGPAVESGLSWDTAWGRSGIIIGAGAVWYGANASQPIAGPFPLPELQLSPFADGTGFFEIPAPDGYEFSETDINQVWIPQQPQITGWGGQVFAGLMVTPRIWPAGGE